MADLDDLELQAFLDGQLDPDREAVVAAWLEADPDARRRLRRLAVPSLLLRVAAADPALGPGLSRQAAPPLRADPPRSPGRVAALRAGAVGIAFLLGWGAHSAADFLQADPLPPYAREALESHEAFAEPREATIELPAGQDGDIRRWLSAKLGEPVEVPDLTPLRLRLVGARLVGLEEGAGAQLIYEDAGGHRLTIALTPDEVDGPDRLTVSEHEGLQVGYWRGPRFAYALVARSTPLQVAAIATAAGASPLDP